MKKTLYNKVAMSIIGCLFMILGGLVSQGWALPYPGDGFNWTAADYWTLTDHTTGVQGDATFTLNLEIASYESDFGLYLVDDVNSPSSVTDTFKIFDKNQEPSTYGTIQSVYFRNSGGIWQVSLDQTAWTDFGINFGFYFGVYTGGSSDDSVDYYWFTDRQFNRLADGTSADTNFEHVIVAYDSQNTVARIFLDDQYVNDPNYNGDPWIDTRIGYSDRDFKDMVVTADDVAPVPEPATILLFGTGLIGLAGFARKKVKKS